MAKTFSTKNLLLNKQLVTAAGNVISVNGVGAGTVFDDTTAQLGSSTVQGAIDAAKVLIDATAALVSTSNPTPTGNDLIAGGGVAFVADLDITVSATTYRIQGTQYSSPITNLTAATADPTDPRIDVVVVDSSGTASIITGTPAATPVKPNVDPETQLELTFYLVAANATSLNVNVTDIYLEGSEWTDSQSGGTFNLASTNNPYTGTICIEGTNCTKNNYIQFVAPSDIDPADYDNLVFYIRSKATWPASRSISITLRDGNTQRGSLVTFKHGVLGFDSSITGAYQQIVIPLSLFNANGLDVDTLRLNVDGSGSTIGMYLDDFTLQSGLSAVVDSTRMRWKGVYNAALLYMVNDVVLSGGIQFVCIQSGVGQTPASSATYWQASSAASSGTKTLVQWGAIDGQPPVSDFAGLSTRNSIVAASFNDTTAENLVFVGIIPEGADFTTGIKVRLFWAAASATSGNVVWISAFERGNKDIDSDAFATGVESAPAATNGTNGILTTTEIDHSGSEIDGVGAGEFFRMKLTRKTVGVTENMTGDAQLFAIEIQER